MAGKWNPGALTGATGARWPNQAITVGISKLAQTLARAKQAAPRYVALAILAASLDPATLAALGLVAARFWASGA